MKKNFWFASVLALSLALSQAPVFACGVGSVSGSGSGSGEVAGLTSSEDGRSAETV